MMTKPPEVWQRIHMATSTHVHTLALHSLSHFYPLTPIANDASTHSVLSDIPREQQWCNTFQECMDGHRYAVIRARLPLA